MMGFALSSTHVTMWAVPTLHRRSHTMQFITPKRLWLLLTLGSLTLAIASLVLTAILHLHPCYLCVFQRILYFLIAIFGIIGFLSYPRFATFIFGALVILIALTGAITAGYQVWLQAQPGDEFSCSPAEPNAIELMVIWLGGISPTLFAATGNCASKELEIFTLSLAQWSFLGFITNIILASWALVMHIRLKLHLNQ